jgi:uncharacterized protein (UPF0218 family)
MKKPESVAYIVTARIMPAFKEPFGELIKGVPSETMAELKQIVERQKTPKIISVGDTVSINLHKYGMVPQLAVTDSLAMRKKIEPQQFGERRLIKVKNPPGTITQQAADAIRQAVQSQDHIHILVEGEEDLLTLIVVLFAPENSLVVYGQPNEGIVVVRVTPEKRTEAERIWKAMKKVEK